MLKLKLRDVIAVALGTLLGGSAVYTALSYKHSAGPFRGDQGAEQGRSPRWASRMPATHLRNFYKVSDALYRGAQPDRQGFLELERLGIKTVINLRLGASDVPMLAGTTLKAMEIPAEAWQLEDREVEQFLRTVMDRDQTPVFVHCSHGADRTGAMTAIYRIVVQGWSKDEAIAEMTTGGFGYHALWKNLPEYIGALDIVRLKAATGG